MDKTVKARTRWTDRAILNADIHTMDKEECIMMLRSRGVDVPDKVSQIQLANHLKALQQRIKDQADQAGMQTEAEPRRRGSSRKKVATKSGFSNTTMDDTEEQTETVAPARPKRRSGPAATKQAAEEVNPEPEEGEDEDKEPEKKRRRSSSKPAAKRRSSSKPAAKRPATEEEKQDQEQEEQQAEEPVKRKKSNVVRGKKRGAENPVEELKGQQQQEEEEEKEKPKDAKRRRGSSVSKGRRLKNAIQTQPEDDSMQDGQQPTEQPAPEVPRMPVSPQQAVLPQENPVPEKSFRPSLISRLFQTLITRSPQKVAPQPPAPAEIVDEHVMRDAREVQQEEDEVEDEEAEVEPQETPLVKKFTVTKKLEIIVMSVGLALLAVFASLAIMLSMQDHGCENGMVWNGNECQYPPKLLNDVYSYLKRFLSHANYLWKQIDHTPENAEEELLKKLSNKNLDKNNVKILSDKQVAITLQSAAELIRNTRLPKGVKNLEGMVDAVVRSHPELQQPEVEGEVLVSSNETKGSLLELSCEELWEKFRVPLINFVLFGSLFASFVVALYYVKRYLDKFSSTEQLKTLCCDILKEQLRASSAQASALAGVPGSDPVSVLSPTLPLTDLKAQVLGSLPVEEQSNWVVRFRMNRAISALLKTPSVRSSSSVVDGKPVESLVWVGNI